MQVIGADVWKGKWCAVALREGRFERALVHATITEVLADLPSEGICGIDIPIGLPNGNGRRRADELAREFVGPRRQSVFYAPPHELLAAPTLAAANQLARLNGWEGVSAQTYGLQKHIAEVNPVARIDKRIFEVHPEVSFVLANAGRTLQYAKTSWNGHYERHRILRELGVEIPDDLGTAGRAGLPDVLDAAIVAWSADRIARGEAVSFPATTERLGAIWG